MHIFYTPDIESSAILPQDQSKHAIQALRLKVGDHIMSFDGKGNWFELEIIVAHAKRCEVTIQNKTSETPSPKHYHIAIAPTKSIDRYEWFLEKATELGVQEISPIISQRSERKIVKYDRSLRIIIAACKQSKKATVPQLNEARTLKEFLDHEELKGDKFIAYLPTGRTIALLQKAYQSKEQTTILIGPEGDFSDNEVWQAEAKGYIPISLGKSRLRTETAGIAALQTLNILDA